MKPSHPSAFPRSKERGFIEAFPFRYQHPTTPSFRVQKNAASLKRDGLDQDIGVLLRFPRSKERGFIEAF